MPPPVRLRLASQEFADARDAERAAAILNSAGWSVRVDPDNPTALLKGAQPRELSLTVEQATEMTAILNRAADAPLTNQQVVELIAGMMR